MLRTRMNTDKRGFVCFIRVHPRNQCAKHPRTNSLHESVIIRGWMSD